MGNIGKPLRRIVLEPMPDDIPVPEIVPQAPAPAPEPAKIPVPSR